MSAALISTCVGGRRAGATQIIVASKPPAPAGLGLDALTPRQLTTIKAVILHGCDKRAAIALGLSFKTVESHMAQARQRMQVTNRVHLLLAVDRLITPRQGVPE